MTGENDFSPIADEILNGGDSSSDPSIISDVLIIVEGHIEVSPHKDLLALELSRTQVAHALLRHGGDASDGLGGGAAE